jgi:non-specific serine/threonine protein kinase
LKDITVVDLPIETTNMVGRERELAEVRRLLTVSRLLTLIGPGGVGKTRLALRAARTMADEYPDGVHLVRLDSLGDPALLARAVSDALGLDDSAKDPLARTIEFVHGKNLLLVLDNCEHLAGACASFAETLLSSAAEVRLLITSQHILGVDGEQLLSVPPLKIMGIDALQAGARGDAVTLFGDRARAAVPDFVIDQENLQIVAQICSRLDGIPLAIEHAAMWIPLFTPKQILDRLDNRFKILIKGSRVKPARQQTLAAAMGWSYDLCSAKEAQLWARLSVFAEGFTLDAAEAVCFDPGEGDDLLELVSGLVDKSILIPDVGQQRTRFRMLDTIREYGLLKLAQSGEKTVIRRRQRDHFLAMAERASAAWVGPDQLELADWARREHANLAAAMDFSLSDEQEAADGARLAVALRFYWVNCRRFSEGMLWLDRVLAFPQLPLELRVRAIVIRVHIETMLGDADKAASMAAAAVALARRQTDPVLLGNALLVQAGSAVMQAESAKADALYAECIELYKTAGGKDREVIVPYTARSMSAAFSRQSTKAAKLANRAVEVAESCGEKWTRSYALYALALAEWQLQDVTKALRHARESIAIMCQFGDTLGQAFLVELCAWIAAGKGDGTQAATLLGVADRIWLRAGGRPMLDSEIWRRPHQNCEQQARSMIGNKAFQAAFDKGVALTIDLPHAIGYVLGKGTEAAPHIRDPACSILTKREAQIAALITKGITNQAIATILAISRRTVEAHVEHILEKLGFRSRTQIATWVTEQQNRSA